MKHSAPKNVRSRVNLMSRANICFCPKFSIKWGARRRPALRSGKYLDYGNWLDREQLKTDFVAELLQVASGHYLLGRNRLPH